MLHGVTWTQFFRDLYREASDDNIFSGAAALGYYLTLALFPAMILTISVLPYLPIQDVDQAIMDLLRQALPGQAAQLVSGVVHDVTSQRRGGLLSFGMVATLWVASSGMYAVMQQLNITYDVKEGRNFLRARATAVGLSVLFGLLVIGAFSLVVLGGVIQDWLGQHVGFSTPLLAAFAVFRWVVIILALLLGFAVIYRFGPNLEQKFAFITPGGVIGVILLIAASLGFAFYTQNFGNYDATYGSIGAVIILMLWLYIAGLVLLLGSEVNALVERYAADGKQKGEKTEAGHAPSQPARSPHGFHPRAHESRPHPR